MGRFLAQKWINDSDSRREAEREMARAGATMCRALSKFYREVCKWEEVDVRFCQSVAGQPYMLKDTRELVE